MAQKIYPYLIHTEGLSESERENLLLFLDNISFMSPQIVAKSIGQSPQYLLYCYLPVDKFSKLDFPCKFRWDDLTGRDLTKL